LPCGKQITRTARYDRGVRSPLITITCDCGTPVEVAYGDRWSCPECGKTWDTAQIPADDYDVLVRGVNRYRWLVLGPPILIAAIMIPLAVLVGIQFAFLLFVLVMGWALLVVPQLRRRAANHMQNATKRWKLRPE
jgi:hypothetical protein